MPGKAAKMTITERPPEILQTLRNAVPAPSRLRQRTSLILLAFHAAATTRSPRRSAWPKAPSDSGGAAGRGASTASSPSRAPRPSPRSAGPSRRSSPMSPGPTPPANSPPSRSPRSSPSPASPPRSPAGRSPTGREGAADEVVTRDLVASISPSQVGRSLRAAAVPPPKSRYWLKTTEKDPEKFAQQAQAVCDTSLTAPALEQSHGTLTVRVDEMTGRQRWSGRLPPGR